jgi:hypothetical protein
MHNECGQRFYYRYVLGKRQPPGAFLIRGSAVDKSVTADLDNKIETDELLPDDIIEDIAAEYVEKEKDSIELIDDEERKIGKEKVVAATKDEAVTLARLHHSGLAPTLKPFKTQRGFSLDMDAWLRDRAKKLHREAEAVGGYAAKILEGQARALNAMAREGFDLAGTIDIHEKFDGARMIRNEEDEMLARSVENVVRDTKTSGKSPAAGIADESDQLTEYALAIHVLEGRLPDRLVLDYLVSTKTPKIVSVPTTRTEDDIEVFYNRLVATIYSIHTGVFVPTKATDWRCSQKWCGYFDICPYAKKPKTAMVSKEVVTTVEEAPKLIQIEGTKDNGN